MRSACIVALLCATFGIAKGQTSSDRTINARDLFWSGTRMSEVSPNAARPTGGPATSEANQSGTTNTAIAVSGGDGVKRVTANRVTELGYGDAPRLTESAAGLLGLRYTMLERDEATGRYSEVLPSSIFRAGDRIRLSVMPNQPGYLYIIQLGTSGDWTSLFPKEIRPTDAERLAGGGVYGFPREEGRSFQFDRRAGTEHLFLIFMRSPATSMGEVTSRLRQPEEHHHDMLASPHTGGGDMCTSPTDAPASRDLLITTVGNQDGQSGMEHAVYVVNRVSATDSNAMIVACLSITHQ